MEETSITKLLRIGAVTVGTYREKRALSKFVQDGCLAGFWRDNLEPCWADTCFMRDL
jgi:hypothetical protein